MRPLAPLLACAPRGVLFFVLAGDNVMMTDPIKPEYKKLPLSIEAQADLLISRGLQGIDKSGLFKNLERVSYYRWRGYTYPYQDNSKPDTPFLPGVVWDYIDSDYCLDRDLRILIFDALERLEVTLRSQLVLHTSLDHGAQWYADGTLFFNATAWERDRNDLFTDWNRSKDDFVEHHKRTYSDSNPPPAWKVFEATSFGSLSKFFENLRTDLPCRNRIAGFWGFGRHSARVLSSWFHHLNVVRNICAHHGRLYNRIIKVTPIFPSKPLGAWVRN